MCGENGGPLDRPRVAMRSNRLDSDILYLDIAGEVCCQWGRHPCLPPFAQKQENAAGKDAYPTEDLDMI
jgi:hypothetical protein